MTRRPQYLYINEPLIIAADPAETGTTTLTAWVAESPRGVPSPIGTLTGSTSSAVGTPAEYVVSFAPALLQLELSTYVTRPVWVHVRSSATMAHEVYPCQVTDVDPDLLPTLL